MEVDFAFLADAAEALNGKIYVLGGAFDTIWASNVPVVYPRMSLVMRLLFSPAEVGRKHKLEINIMDADGKRIAAVGGDLQVGQSPDVPAGWKHGFLTVLNFGNLRFEKLGDYSIEIAANNFSLKPISLRVAQRLQLQAGVKRHPITLSDGRMLKLDSDSSAPLHITQINTDFSVCLDHWALRKISAHGSLSRRLRSRYEITD